MRNTLRLFSLTAGFLLLGAVAEAQTYTVTFTLTCDKGASATLTPTTNMAPTFGTIGVLDAANNRADCGITSMQCGPTQKTDQQVCLATGLSSPPVWFFTSDNVGQTLAVVSKDGTNTTCVAEGAIPSNDTDCSGSHKNGAKLVASRAQ